MIAAAMKVDRKIRQLHGGWKDPRMPDVYTEVHFPPGNSRPPKRAQETPQTPAWVFSQRLFGVDSKHQNLKYRSVELREQPAGCPVVVLK